MSSASTRTLLGLGEYVQPRVSLQEPHPWVPSSSGPRSVDVSLLAARWGPMMLLLSLSLLANEVKWPFVPSLAS